MKTKSNQTENVLLLDGKEIKQTLEQKMKNYKCIFPGCMEIPKSRYNCYTHVWDTHLRYEFAKPGKNPKNYPLLKYKDCPNKSELQKECSKYIVKLIYKTPEVKLNMMLTEFLQKCTKTMTEKEKEDALGKVIDKIEKMDLLSKTEKAIMIEQSDKTDKFHRHEKKEQQRNKNEIIDKSEKEKNEKEKTDREKIEKLIQTKLNGKMNEEVINTIGDILGKSQIGKYGNGTNYGTVNGEEDFELENLDLNDDCFEIEYSNDDHEKMKEIAKLQRRNHQSNQINQLKERSEMKAQKEKQMEEINEMNYDIDDEMEMDDDLQALIDDINSLHDIKQIKSDQNENSIECNSSDDIKQFEIDDISAIPFNHLSPKKQHNQNERKATKQYSNEQSNEVPIKIKQERNIHDYTAHENHQTLYEQRHKHSKYPFAFEKSKYNHSSNSNRETNNSNNSLSSGNQFNYQTIPIKTEKDQYRKHSSNQVINTNSINTHSSYTNSIPNPSQKGHVSVVMTNELVGKKDQAINSKSSHNSINVLSTPTSTFYTNGMHTSNQNNKYSSSGSKSNQIPIVNTSKIQEPVMVSMNSMKPKVSVNESKQNQFSSDDFVRIERINDHLQQLHVYGEIFSENGFLVRSDARSKKDIQHIHSALSGLLSLEGVSYSYGNDDDNSTRYGFIAQDVEKSFPHLVQRDVSGQLSVDYLGVIPLLVEALKEIHNQSIEIRNCEEMEMISNKVNETITQLEEIKHNIANESRFETKDHFISDKKNQYTYVNSCNSCSTLSSINVYHSYILYNHCSYYVDICNIQSKRNKKVPSRKESALVISFID